MQILKILECYNAAEGSLGLHRLIEAMKHMFAVRMDLGDPDFVNISKTVSDMLSPSFAKEIQRKIFDNTTFPPEYYMPRLDKFYFLRPNYVAVCEFRESNKLTLTMNLDIESFSLEIKFKSLETTQKVL